MLASFQPATGTAATLADYTTESLIAPQLKERDTAGVIQELSQRLHQESLIPDLLPFYNAAMNREYLISTAMDCGIAFPHARMGGLKRLSFALGKCERPIAWGSKGNVPVDVVFLMAVPATDATGYLQMLSAVAKLSKNAELMRPLRLADSAGTIFEIFRQIKMPHGRPPI